MLCLFLLWNFVSLILFYTHLNKTKNFTLAKFHPDWVWKMETNSLLLYSILDVILFFLEI